MVALLVFSCVVLSAGVSSADPPFAETAGARPGARPGIVVEPPPRPSLLLITIDTLRADHLGSYGYDAGETPHLDRLAREGVRFDQVATTVPLTLPAHASIMTGQYPPRHGVRDNVNFQLSAAATTLAEVLRSAGYATGGFVGAAVLDAHTGIAQGFDVYSDLPHPGKFSEGHVNLSAERPGEVVALEALSWIAAQPEEFFAWVHLFDPHDPYLPPSPFRERYAGREYDGEVAYVDHVVGQLISGLEHQGRSENMVVVVTADHGEGLGDHGERLHSLLVYDSTVRVPLILWAPGRLPADITVRGQASVVDIMPTTLGLLGVRDPLPESRDGADLRQRVDARDAPGRPAYVETLLPLLELGWSELRSLRTRDFKYIAAPRPELYDLRADVGEADNVIDRWPQRAAAMRDELAELVGGDDVSDLEFGRRFMNSDAESQLDNLRALGYIGATARPSSTAYRDPKDDIEALEAFQNDALAAERAIARGNWPEADHYISALAGLLPGHPLVHFYRGRARLLQGNAAGAVAELEETIALTPGNPRAWLDLAAAYRAMRDKGRSYEVLVSAAGTFPDFGIFPQLLGSYLQQDGRLEEAEQAYLAALHLAPQHPVVLRSLGNLYLQRGDYAAGREVLTELVDVFPGDGESWTALAATLCNLGEMRQCEAALRKAVEAEPDRAQVHFILGTLLVQQGREAEAAKMFRRTLRLDPRHWDAIEALSRIAK